MQPNPAVTVNSRVGGGGGGGGEGNALMAIFTVSVTVFTLSDKADIEHSPSSFLRRYLFCSSISFLFPIDVFHP